MNTIQAKRERLAAINKAANAQLAEKGDRLWTKDDQAAFDAAMDEADGIKAQINNEQRLLDQAAEANFRDAQRADPDDKRTPLQKGLDIFLRKSNRQMSAEEAIAVRNTMSTTTGSEGGFTVQPMIARELIDLLKAYGFMRAVADVITTDTGVDLSYPTSDGTSEIGEIVAQNTVASAADVTFGTRPLNVFKFGSKVITVPIELLQDSSIDVTGMVMKRMRDRIGRIENVKFTVGSGTAEPNGVVTASGVGKTGITGQTTSLIYDDLVDLVDSLDVAYLTGEGVKGEGPEWMFGQTLRRVVRKIKDTTGRPIWTPGYEAGATAATPDMLMGYPVEINNDMPAPAANAKSLAFGNFKRYVIRDAMQVTLFRFDDSAFMTKGQVGFLGWARAGGNLMDVNSVKCYQHSAT